MNSPQLARSTSGFRPDIEGLRAIAIVAVLLCHAGIPFAAGGYVGVDVFFVISGLLITRLLLNEVDRTGSVSLRRFYARRAKRLLPLAAVVLLAVVALSFALFSPVRAVETSADVISSAIYTANWHFASQSVDYFAQGGEPSPVQHLWSLAIEEQFYLVWPTLLLAVTWFWRRRGGAVRPVLWFTVAAILVASLAMGIHQTGDQPNAAYFSTFGRAWELALGAALALLGAVRLPGAVAALLGWAGLGAIALSVVAFDAGTPFPGTAALLPTLGTAALILAGSSIYATTRAAPARLLSLRPVRYVGRISYSWYLWHWPAIVFATVIWGPLSLAAGLAVTAASLVPTALTHHWVEEPFRRSRSLAIFPRRGLAFGAACVAVAVVAGVLLSNLQPSLGTAPLAKVKGAAALDEQPTPQRSATAVRPNPLQAREDRSRMYSDGCLVGTTGTKSNKCVYGDAQGKRTMVLFGDSHAMQYFPAMEELAGKHGWRLVALAKAECTPGETEVLSVTTGSEYTECETWRERALKRIEAMGPQTTVVMSGATDYTPVADGGRPGGRARAATLEEGYVATLTRLSRAGLQTAVIKDPPGASSDIPSCVSQELANLESCAFRRVRDVDRDYDARAARKTDGAHLIDVTGEICPDDVCRAVIGNALVYRDKSHLSATFALTLSPWIERGLREAGLV
ncbi:MAG TPA: acyltransferase family protein [Solirubrobacterales bacterium]|nr:acyltransferase family protein [Solirubrobacterales bacterium]